MWVCPGGRNHWVWLLYLYTIVYTVQSKDQEEQIIVDQGSKGASSLADQPLHTRGSGVMPIRDLF